LTTIFFATDVHGSTICWQKFINAGKFYGAQILILGGDITGKAIVPIVHQGNGTYQVVLLENESILESEDEVKEIEKRISSRGYYPYRTTPDEIDELKTKPEKLDKLFTTEVKRRLTQWVECADQKLKDLKIQCYVTLGNDDIFELDAIVRESKYIQLVEGEKIVLDDHYEMISSGWSNVTPWHTIREESEDMLAKRYEKLTSGLSNPHTSIFNIHVPPYGSSLDDAPEMTKDLRPKFAGNSLVPVGSHALRKSIEEVKPLLGLFGHIHESKGTSRIGKTLCINPGSMYEQGALCGALITLNRDKVKSHVLTTG
jgi:uncharacterized protein